MRLTPKQELKTFQRFHKNQVKIAIGAQLAPLALPYLYIGFFTDKFPPVYFDNSYTCLLIVGFLKRTARTLVG
jgi:hypothetical protein